MSSRVIKNRSGSMEKNKKNPSESQRGKKRLNTSRKSDTEQASHSEVSSLKTDFPQKTTKASQFNAKEALKKAPSNFSMHRENRKTKLRRSLKSVFQSDMKNKPKMRGSEMDLFDEEDIKYAEETEINLNDYKKYWTALRGKNKNQSVSSKASKLTYRFDDEKVKKILQDLLASKISQNRRAMITSFEDCFMAAQDLLTRQDLTKKGMLTKKNTLELIIADKCKKKEVPEAVEVSNETLSQCSSKDSTTLASVMPSLGQDKLKNLTESDEQSSGNDQVKVSKKGFWDSLDEFLEGFSDITTQEGTSCSELSNLKLTTPATIATSEELKMDVFELEEEKEDKLQSEDYGIENELSFYVPNEIPNPYIDDCSVQRIKPPIAAEICRGFVDGCLDLFGARNPSKTEYEGMVYDTIRQFAKLPPEVASNRGEINVQGLRPEPPVKPDNRNLESEERMVTRFRIYEKALIFFAEHFSSLTPLLSEIKLEYDDLLRSCERECKKTDKLKTKEVFMRKRLLKIVRKIDQRGEWQIMRSELILHKLLEHEASLRQVFREEEVLAKKLKVLYKNKVEEVAKEAVSAPSTGSGATFDSSVTDKFHGKYSEEVRSEDQRTIQIMLFRERKKQEKLYRKLIIYESNYTELAAKTDYDAASKELEDTEKKLAVIRSNADALEKQIEELKDNIQALKEEATELGVEYEIKEAEEQEEEEEEETNL